MSTMTSTLLLLVTLAASAPTRAAPDTTVILRRPASHAMCYHVALPRGWTAEHDWPVLVVIPDASRDFAGNLRAFMQARGDRPYILVAPEVLSCGGARSRTRDLYTYSAAEWESLQSGDDFAFEDAGFAAVLADVHRQWRGDSRAYLTGWEAGGHTVWAEAFRHPERWRGVAPVTPNYQRRGLTPATWSHASQRAALAIQPLRCGAPQGEDAALLLKSVDTQTAAALADAREHGFKPRAVHVVPGADHGPLPDAVLAWCDSLRKR
jgi:dienelactone hydrolase